MLGLLFVLAADPLEGDPAPAVQEPVREESCSLITETHGQSHVVGPLAGLRVLNGPDRLPIFVTPGGNLEGIVCDRTSIVPDVRDDRVPRLLGVPLYVNRSDPGATVELLQKGGRFSLILVDGKWTAAEKRDVIARINLFNERSSPP